MGRAIGSAEARAAESFARALFASAPRDAFVELRVRHGAGMAQSFHRVDALGEFAARAVANAEHRDVYFGVIARRRRSGGRRDLVERAAAVWVDCDGADAVRALQAFTPAPQLVVASGSGPNRHAYWLLQRASTLDAIEHINRRLAAHLGGDARAADAARILRLPGTANWKARTPSPVRLLTCEPDARIAVHELERQLPELAASRPRSHADAGWPRGDTDDPLLDIAPAEYVERLSGVSVGRDGKVSCPFHDDATPSPHAFAEPERGWYCFGCGRGGSIYDFAALIWQRGLRGAEFARLRRDLDATFLGGTPSRAPTPHRRTVCD